MVSSNSSVNSIVQLLFVRLRGRGERPGSQIILNLFNMKLNYAMQGILNAFLERLEWSLMTNRMLFKVTLKMNWILNDRHRITLTSPSSICCKLETRNSNRISSTIYFTELVACAIIQNAKALQWYSNASFTIADGMEPPIFQIFVKTFILHFTSASTSPLIKHMQNSIRITTAAMLCSLKLLKMVKKKSWK